MAAKEIDLLSIPDNEFASQTHEFKYRRHPWRKGRIMTDVFMNTYHRLPVTFAHGRGSWLVDIEGRRYLDFTAGIAVNCLGHGHPALTKAIADQAAKLNHVSNYYQSDVSAAFAEKLVAACSPAGMQKVFLGNSGAEANEGACKIARKYSLKKYGPGRHRIATLRGSFHGRTITTLAATGQDRFHRDFGPFTEGFLYVPGGDIAALDRALDKNTVAGLLVEAIQGESGIVPQTQEYLAAAAKLCADRDILATLRGSFHGRTITTLAATGQDRFHRDFGPFTEGFLYVPGGDIAALDRALDKNTVAGLLVEAIQGESGIVPQTQEYLAAAAKLCADRDILLMFDEIQSGVGRTGTFLACEAYGVQPDIVTLAKGLSGGVPVGAVLAGEKAAEVFETGDHGSTFGGNPLAAAAGLVVLETVNTPAFLGEIARKGEKIMAGIRSWRHPEIREVRGKGLMIGMDIAADAWPVLEKAIARADPQTPGLLAITAGPKTLRFLPPYTISDAEIDQGLAILRDLL